MRNWLAPLGSNEVSCRVSLSGALLLTTNEESIIISQLESNAPDGGFTFWLSYTSAQGTGTIILKGYGLVG